MKFVVFEEGAIDELVSSRSFQSIEFDLACNLFNVISGNVSSEILHPEIFVLRLNGGIAIAKKSASNESHFLVIDLEHSQFFEFVNEAGAIFVLQKTMRLAKKLWQKMSLNFSERIIPSSSKAVLFPFPYEPKPYRVVIERTPWEDRLKRRGYAGKFLLVYKTGYDKGDANTEKADLTNFKKAFGQIDGIISNVRNLSNEQRAQPSSIVQVSTLDDSPKKYGDTSMFQPFDDWMTKLSSKQRAFIESKITGVHRLEGAAGTGKTLCLMLKAVSFLRTSENDGTSKHIVFVTHSEATKRAIKEFLLVIDAKGFATRNRELEKNTLKVCTLSDLCAEQLAQHINETEFIDRDALESKETQLLYVNKAYIEAMNTDFSTHERFLSTELKEFLKNTEEWDVTEMLQHEISVMIKGRAAEDFETYKKAPSLKYGIPNCSDADKGFIFSVFRKYQEQLGEVSQFDTDDVVLTAIGQLDTPIWRRRRDKDGYDVVFIDETHLFNINELHLFHYFTRSYLKFHIIYSVDRSQAVGDQGWTNREISENLSRNAVEEEVKFQTVFRSSQQIVQLAFSILSSGAALFTNFDNPLELTWSGFTAIDEDINPNRPCYRRCPNDQAMIEEAFSRAEKIQKDMDWNKGQILIVAFDNEIVNKLQNFAQLTNKPHIFLNRRGDVKAVGHANDSGKFVLAHADFVGGLQFFGVVAVGVDKGRLPPTKDQSSDDSKQFLSYSSHNRLYVAISRAKYRVELLGDQSRGPSELIVPALESDLLEEF